MCVQRTKKEKEKDVPHINEEPQSCLPFLYFLSTVQFIKLAVCLHKRIAFPCFIFSLSCLGMLPLIEETLVFNSKTHNSLVQIELWL